MDQETIKKIEAVNNDGIPLFPRELIEKTVKHYFDAKDKYLKLYENYKRPVYVFEKEILKRKAVEFRAAFESFIGDTAFFLAMKCNNHPQVLKAAIECGYGADVSSGLEL